jgi:hypothetical protein
MGICAVVSDQIVAYTQRSFRNRRVIDDDLSPKSCAASCTNNRNRLSLKRKKAFVELTVHNFCSVQGDHTVKGSRKWLDQRQSGFCVIDTL